MQSQYQLIITELLLQRTKAETVSRYSTDFFSKFPNWESIMNSVRSDLEDKLKPMGIQKKRANTLYSLACSLSKIEYNLPSNEKDLLKLPGIGQYMSNAILLLCYGKPKPLLDINMARLLERFFGKRKLADIRYDSYLHWISNQVVNHKNCIEINWSILDFASQICLIKKPKCSICPLSSKCKYYGKLSCLNCKELSKVP